ncbi:MAG: hypothetical protein GY772_01405, partial [bacterium]|nr:hypothetical protein [bacterium]
MASTTAGASVPVQPPLPPATEAFAPAALAQDYTRGRPPGTGANRIFRDLLNEYATDHGVTPQVAYEREGKRLRALAQALSEELLRRFAREPEIFGPARFPAGRFGAELDSVMLRQASPAPVPRALRGHINWRDFISKDARHLTPAEPRPLLPPGSAVRFPEMRFTRIGREQFEAAKQRRGGASASTPVGAAREPSASRSPRRRCSASSASRTDLSPSTSRSAVSAAARRGLRDRARLRLRTASGTRVRPVARDDAGPSPSGLPTHPGVAVPPPPCWGVGAPDVERGESPGPSGPVPAAHVPLGCGFAYAQPVVASASPAAAAAPSGDRRC